MYFGNIKIIIICVVVAVYLQEVAVQSAPTFIRTCASPLVTNHSNNYHHSYCYHACGFKNTGISPANDPSQCTMDGDCLCSFPCTNDDTIDQKNYSFDKDFCNPPRVGNSSNPVDPDHLAHPQCISRCASRCPGGSGVLCGQVMGFEAPEAKNAYLKICTCFCPVLRCPLPPVPPVTNNITINNTNNTTVVVYNIVTNNTTTNDNTTTIAVIPSSSAALIASVFLLVKVYGLWALQTVFMGIYSTLLYGVVSFIQLA